MTSAELLFSAPATLADALRELAEPDAVAVAGGTSLAMLVREGLVEPGRLVSLGHVPELFGIEYLDGALRIGAMTTLREIASSDAVRRHAPSLAAAAAEVGNPRVRAVATLGGAVCHADPRQDIPPVLLVSGASVLTVGGSGPRRIDVADFYTGFMETGLLEDEIVTAVIVPVRPDERTHYLRFTPNSTEDWPTLCVAVSLRTDAGMVITSARIALGGADATAVLVPAASAVLVGHPGGDASIRAAAAAAAEHCDPTADSRGSADYKRAMVEVIVRRTIRAALG